MRFFVGTLLWLGIMCLVMLCGEFVLSALRVIPKPSLIDIAGYLIVGMISWSYAMDTILKELKK